MRKLHYILAGLVLVFALGSCEKNDKHDLEVDAMKAAKADKAIVEMGSNEPVSNAGVVPEVIPGENKGGNRTCEEVWAAFGDPEDVYLCGDKVDWDDDAEGFASSFPDGLNVTVTGIHVGFTIDGCLEIDGNFYKVGAVIVKGSNAANVYFYEGGTTADFGLAAPGNKHMVSNLTFCFVPCIPEEGVDLVVALKASITHSDRIADDVAYSYSEDKFPGSNIVGYVPYELTENGVEQEFPLYSELLTEADPLTAQIGTFKVKDYFEGSIHYIEVNIDTDDDDWTFGSGGCLLYIGSEAGLLSLNNVLDFPFFNNSPAESRMFKIALN